ncbi:TauD/TfdA family dioxygenase [Luminiphilus sp.]|mgnify:FL=1|nr:TauD/TfdA family dioxygenase [Luminiphilus sp.]MDA9710990.1 TauD/TfdA family dioxygenase [Luminiphilus sp.]
MYATRSLSTTFGAEVLEFQLTENPLSEDIVAIRELWAEHKLLLFRNQSFNEAGLVGFSRHFGDLEIHVREEYLSQEHPEILYVSNIERNGRRIGILSDNEVGWHYDQIYLPKPAVGSLLMADTLPPEGGNTEFADMCAAWDALPEKTKIRLDGALANQSYEAFNQAYSVPTNNKQKARSPDIHHPIARTHPVTGRKALYLCPGMTTEIVGWDLAESEEMLAFLFDWTTKPEFVYSHAWQPGDALMWDNACTMHRRDPFDPQHDRLMKRTTILPPADLAVPF